VVPHAKQRRGRLSISQRQADPASKAKRAPVVFLLADPGGVFGKLFEPLSTMQVIRQNSKL
jgi:hypothetical protein